MIPFPLAIATLLFLTPSPSYSDELEWEADIYTGGNSLQAQWAQRFFFDHYHFTGNEAILDVGCGDGSLTHQFSLHTGGIVVGFDLSSDMITHARSHYQDLHTLFICAPAEEYAFYKVWSNSFDLVTAFHSLHWVEKQSEALRGIYEALRPGGKAFIRLCSDGFDPVQSIADELVISAAWKDQFIDFKDPIQRFSIKQYEALLMERGFQIISLHEQSDTDLLTDVEQLRNHIRGWLPHYRFLPEGKKEIFLDELVSYYLKLYPPASDSPIELPDSYLEVIAMKP